MKKMKSKTSMGNLMESARTGRLHGSALYTPLQHCLINPRRKNTWPDALRRVWTLFRK